MAVFEPKNDKVPFENVIWIWGSYEVLCYLLVTVGLYLFLSLFGQSSMLFLKPYHSWID